MWEGTSIPHVKAALKCCRSRGNFTAIAIGLDISATQITTSHITTRRLLLQYSRRTWSGYSAASIAVDTRRFRSLIPAHNYAPLCPRHSAPSSRRLGRIGKRRRRLTVSQDDHTEWWPIYDQKRSLVGRPMTDFRCGRNTGIAGRHDVRISSMPTSVASRNSPKVMDPICNVGGRLRPDSRPHRAHGISRPARRGLPSSFDRGR